MANVTSAWAPKLSNRIGRLSDWMEHLGDPTFEYHVTVTRVWGLLALRLANADFLPLDFGAYGAALRTFLHELDARTQLGAHIDLRELQQRLNSFETEGHALTDTLAISLQQNLLDPRVVPSVNNGLMSIESNWLYEPGIPGRPWFQHLLYAARYTYAHLELPGLAEAAERGDWKEAAAQAKLIQRAVDTNVAALRSVRAQLNRTGDTLSE